MSLRVFTFALVLLFSRSAWSADQPVASAPPGALELSLKAGGHFPQLTNPLGTSFDGILKVGYGVTRDRRLQVFLDFAYTQPSNTVTGSDPRLGEMGSGYRSTLTIRDLSNTLGVAYFIPAGQPWLLPYAGGGLQIHFVKSTERATTDAGVLLGEHTETATGLGAAVFGGAGFRLGPGLLLGELRFGYTPVSQRVTGSSNIGALSVLVGYGIML
jgi:hypothetical protein